VKSQTFDLNFEQQNLTSDPFAHKDNIVLKNNLLGISIINSEWDLNTGCLNARLAIFDSLMVVKHKYLFTDNNNLFKLVPLDFKQSKVSKNYFVAGYTIDQSQNLHPWLMILDSVGNFVTSNYLNMTGIISKIIQFNDTLISCGGVKTNGTLYNNSNRELIMWNFNTSGKLVKQFLIPHSSLNLKYDMITDIKKLSNKLIVTGTYSKICTNYSNDDPTIFLMCINPLNGFIYWQKEFGGGKYNFSPIIAIKSGDLVVGSSTCDDNGRIFLWIGDTSGNIVKCRKVNYAKTFSCSDNSTSFVPKNFNSGSVILQFLDFSSANHLIGHGKFILSNCDVPFSFDYEINKDTTISGNINLTDFNMPNSDLFSYEVDSSVTCDYLKCMAPFLPLTNIVEFRKDNYICATFDRITYSISPLIDFHSKTWIFTKFKSSVKGFKQHYFRIDALGIFTVNNSSFTFLPVNLSTQSLLPLTKTTINFNQFNYSDFLKCPN
jgi:hypothetical protein